MDEGRNDQKFLLRIITGVKTWVYCYELRPLFSGYSWSSEMVTDCPTHDFKKYFLAVFPDVAELLDLLY
jgi:hypothetical protein